MSYRIFNHFIAQKAFANVRIYAALVVGLILGALNVM